MEEFNTIPTKKLWNPKSFIIFSALFSFLPAGIMYSLNLGRCGNKQKKWTSLILTIIGFIVLSAIAYIIPSSTSILKYAFFGINIGIGMYLSNTQGKLYENHIQNGGEKASYIIPVIISVLIVALFVVAIIYSIFLPSNSLSYNKSKVYYTDNVTKSEAEKLGDYLESQDFFNADSEADVKIDKENDIYIFSLIIDEKYLDEKEIMDNMKLICTELSENVFDNNDVRLDLCDGRFKVLKSVSPD